MSDSILDAIEYLLEELGEAQSPFWIASQLEEMRLWRASEHDVRAALEHDIAENGDNSRFVRTADDEWSMRSWTDQ